MMDQWEKNLACADRCGVCGGTLLPKDRRVLSIYTHRPICLACKRKEERRLEYADMSKAMIAECIETTGKPYGDPGGYCFHHFCPYKC